MKEQLLGRCDIVRSRTGVPVVLREDNLELWKLVSSRDLCLGDHAQACLRLRLDRKQGADGNILNPGSPNSYKVKRLARQVAV